MGADKKYSTPFLFRIFESSIHHIVAFQCAAVELIVSHNLSNDLIPPNDL